jgi:hypothetical protein
MSAGRGYTIPEGLEVGPLAGGGVIGGVLRALGGFEVGAPHQRLAVRRASTRHFTTSRKKRIRAAPWVSGSVMSAISASVR